MKPKYVKRAGLWCVSEITVDQKTKHHKQTIHWFPSQHDAGDYIRTKQEAETKEQVH